MSWTIFSFLRKINIRAKEVHESDVWAEDVNEICDAIQKNADDIQNFQSTQSIQTLSDAWPDPIGSMSVRAYATNYPILINYYNAPAKTVTHDVIDPVYVAANPTHERQDSIAADIQGNILIIKGAVGPVSFPPTVNPETHYLIRNILIPSNAATTGVVDPGTGTPPSVVIVGYRENLGVAGGEADATSSNASINVNSSNSLIGLKSIEATNPLNIHKYSLSWTTMKSTVNITHIQFRLKLKANVLGTNYWFIGLLKGGARIANTWYLFKNGQNGFNSFTTVEQTILIDIQATPFQNQDFNGFEQFFFGNTVGYTIDNVEFLNGLPSNPNNPPSATHTHTNLTVLNGITSTLITAFNNAVTWIATNGANLINHLTDTANPHNVTKTQLILDQVDNTSDLNKPVSNATVTALGLKLDASAYIQHFKGKYLTSSALIVAHPTAIDGDYATVDAGAGVDAKEWIWDVEAGWIVSSAAAAGTTDSLTEGSTNLYFTATRVLSTVLTGISFVTGGDVLSTDSILIAIGKIDKKIRDLIAEPSQITITISTISTPINEAFTAGIGTLVGATYYYRVTAINANGETLPSTETSLKVGISTPVNAAFTAGIGTLAAATYYYRVSAINAIGETLASAETSFAAAANTGVNVNWGAVTGATGYKVYGRSTGAELLIATVGLVTTYLDDGSITPAGSLPAANTTADGGVNVNWGSVTGATGYKVYGRSTGAELLIATVGLVLTYLDDGSLTPAGALPTVNSTFLKPTSETLSDGGYTFDGKNLLIKNGVNAINFTVGATENQIFSIQKEGTGAITFIASAGKTLRLVDTTAIMDGVVGSTATISVVGIIISLRISNA